MCVTLVSQYDTDYPCHHTRRKGEALPHRHVELGRGPPALALHGHAPVLDGPKVATLVT